MAMACILVVPALCNEWKDIRKGKGTGMGQGGPPLANANKAGCEDEKMKKDRETTKTGEGKDSTGGKLQVGNDVA